MRRTSRVLSVAVLASAALGIFAGSGSADPGGTPRPAGAGEPAAEVSPADVGPGGTVTVSVTCDRAGEAAPDALDAVSPAFEGGTVALLKVAGADDRTTGAAYRGTARVATAGNLQGDPDAAGPASPWTVDGTCPTASGGEGRPWSAAMTVSSPASGAPEPGRSWRSAAPEPSCRPSAAPREEPVVPRDEPAAPREEPVVPGGEPAVPREEPVVPGGEPAVPREEPVVPGGEPAVPRDETVPYAEPAVPGDETVPDEGVPGDTSLPGEEPVPYAEAAPSVQPALPGQAASTSHTARPGDSGPQGVPCTTKPPCPEPTAGGASCGGGKAEHGVQAGTGGSFTDSVPALAAGGLLIAGAFGGAAYRLRLRLRGESRDH
ncbi:hypothetical protein [Streptomyces flaveolus]|uniref:hypothetical protein n=1 Tax=Streptomyces flaveolus TaxID=67297 RepID=UPI00367E45B6